MHANVFTNDVKKTIGKYILSIACEVVYVGMFINNKDGYTENYSIPILFLVAGKVADIFKC